MVMRPRPTGPPTSRPRPVLRQVYQNFKPDFEWKQEDGLAVLVVNLPGFVKEQIRIQSVEPNRVRIRGMRPAASNTWIRFDQTYLVPDDSTTDETKARFQDGVLEVLFPKKVKNVGSQEKQARPTQQTPLSPLRPPAAQVTDSVPPKPSSSVAPQQQRDGNQSQLPSPPPVPPATATTSGGDEKPAEAPGKPKSETEMDERIAQKPAIAPTQNQIQTAAKRAEDTNLGKATAPRVADNIQREAKNIVEKTATGEDMEKPAATKKAEEALEKPLHQKQTESKEPKLTTEGGAEKKTEGIEPESVTKKRVEKEKMDGPADGVDQKAAIDKQSNARDKGRTAQNAVNGSKFEKYKQMVKDFLTPKDEEERKLLVNIGVAAMVIVALGAYITYSHWSSQKSKKR